jgi:hypothetical protein
MECSLPPPLTDDQLSAALDNSAEPSVMQHLAGCPSCAHRLAAARRIEHTLAGRLRRWDCPAPQQLGDYHLGLLDHSLAHMITLHLEQCVRCQAEIEELRAFLMPNGLLQVQLPRPPARPPRPSLGLLIASLLPRPPALALRGAASDGPIIAEADGVTVVIDLQPAADGRLLLIGQLAAEEQDSWTGALVELRQDGALQGTASLDELGGFSCGPLSPGPTELRISAESGRALLIPEIML